MSPRAGILRARVAPTARGTATPPMRGRFQPAKWERDALPSPCFSSEQEVGALGLIPCVRKQRLDLLPDGKRAWPSDAVCRGLWLSIVRNRWMQRLTLARAADKITHGNHRSLPPTKVKPQSRSGAVHTPAFIDPRECSAKWERQHSEDWSPTCVLPSAHHSGTSFLASNPSRSRKWLPLWGRLTFCCLWYLRRKRIRDFHLAIPLRRKAIRTCHSLYQRARATHSPFWSPICALTSATRNAPSWWRKA